MSGKKGISYVQNDEPEFIKRFKQNVGYKEGPSVDTKVIFDTVIFIKHVLQNFEWGKGFYFQFQNYISVYISVSELHISIYLFRDNLIRGIIL